MKGQNPSPVVIDIGSYTCKAGLSADETTRCSIPTVVGRPKSEEIIIGMGNRKVYVGQSALQKAGLLTLNYPIQNRISVSNWEDLHETLHHCFYQQLRIVPSEQPCLLSTSSEGLKNQRETMTQFMFERFYVPAFYLGMQDILSLYSLGKTTGLVLDAGHAGARAVSISEGHVIPNVINQVGFGGNQLNKFLTNLLKEIGLNFATNREELTSIDIKEKLCYVSLDYEAEMAKYKNSNQYNSEYQLPDGQNISVGNQKFRCTEALFNPKLIDIDSLGIHEAISKSILQSNADLRKDLYSNIVLSGGTTMFLGLQERLNKQLKTLAPQNTEVKVFAPEKRDLSVLIGGSMMTMLSTFQPMWITKKEYEETGASIVHKKCA